MWEAQLGVQCVQVVRLSQVNQDTFPYWGHVCWNAVGPEESQAHSTSAFK